MRTDQYKKEILYRRARGKELLDKYTEKIFDFFAIETKSTPFLSIEGSDNVIYTFHEENKTELIEKYTIQETEIHKEIKNKGYATVSSKPFGRW